MTPTALCPHTEVIARLKQDMWQGDQHKKGVTDRLSDLEKNVEMIRKWQDQVSDSVGTLTVDVDRLTASVSKMVTVAEAVAQERTIAVALRDKQVKTWLALAAMGFGAIEFGMQILWTIVRPHLGL